MLKRQWALSATDWYIAGCAFALAKRCQVNDATETSLHGRFMYQNH